MEYTTIFMESNENMGIVFDSYNKVLPILNSFLDDIEGDIKAVNKDSSTKIDISNKIKKFKEDINIKTTAKPIKIDSIGATVKTIKKFQSELEKTLSRYCKMKDSIAYGGNYIRAIIKKPKVYVKDINSEMYQTVNDSLRGLNRAMDWCEKCLIDLFNLADQDLNIITIVNRIYIKQHIYENAQLPDGVIEEGFKDGNIPLPLSSLGKYDLNTRDKKTGGTPDYIKRNHDMASYGEEDPDEAEVQKKSLDDYRRPSANDDKPASDDNNGKKDDFVPYKEPEKSVTDKKNEDDLMTDEEEKQAQHERNIQNYYYYTYNNSLNKNSHSFNKDNSSHDDHSIHDNHSVKNNDNRVDNRVDNRIINKYPKDEDHKKNDDSFGESVPWSLDLSFDKPSTPYMEEVGDADIDKPESDHPVRDAFMDIDRKTVKYQQKAKKGVQTVQQVQRAAMKPINRTRDWLNNMISNWKDASEADMKEKMADPHSRKNLYSAFKKAIEVGALAKAGLLFNPLLIFLTVTKHATRKQKEFRIRNEMIGELKTELQVIDEKIKDADAKGDNKAKYQLMRFKNEINKKLLRVGGGKGWSKII